MTNKSEKNKIKRMELKNGWDLPPGEKPPLTGRKQQTIRAYELLVLKSDEEYIKEAEEQKRKRKDNLNGKGISQVQPLPSQDQKKSEDEIKYTKDERSSSQEEGKERLEINGIKMISSERLKAKQRKRRSIFLIIIAAIVIAAGSRILFGPPILTANISEYEDVKIEVEGIKDEPFVITPKELADMKKTSTTVDVHIGEVVEGEVPESGDAVGPTLETFLKEYNKSKDDFRIMRVYAENGNSKAYVKTMKEEEIILSVANGSEPLGEKEAPLRIAVSGKDTDEWFGWVRKIVFTK